MSQHGVPTPLPRGAEAESMDQLRGDCARMVPHWTPDIQAASAPVPPSRIQGITVPSSSAALVDGMSEYGD